MTTLEVHGETVAMASCVQVRARSRRGELTAADDGLRSLELAVNRALGHFRAIEQTCTRFVADSPLSMANAAPDSWHEVPRLLADVVLEAHDAYRDFSGRYDPRVLSALVGLGYDHSLAFADGNIDLTRVVPVSDSSPQARPVEVSQSRPKWQPRRRDSMVGSQTCLLHLGRTGIDLGGIAKGIAVRFASEALRTVANDFLVEAGGDCFCSGRAPEGTPWMIGVEDPCGGDEPVAVLAVEDRAVATSSTRLRTWRCNGTLVHHLIDPITGRPGGDGLLSVTVVGSDPARAEVVSKVLFLEGASDIASAASSWGAAALWVDDLGERHCSEAIRPMLAWTAL